MSRLDFRPLGAVATAAVILAYVGCSSSTQNGGDATSSARPETRSAAGAQAGKNSAASSEEKNGALFPRWPAAPKAVLVVSGEMDGYLEPCGCTQGQLGGLIRRYEFVHRLQTENLPHALVDLGGLMKDPSGSRGGPEQAQIKFGVALKALNAFGYNAIGLSAEDLKVGVGEAFAQFLNNLTEPTTILAANVEPGAGFETIIRPSTIAKAGPVTFGVTAVVDPAAIDALHDPDKEALLPTVKPPDEALASVLADLENQSDFQVLLVQGAPAEAERLAAAFPGFDIVVGSSSLVDPEQDPKMLNDGKTMLVNVGRRGKYVGAVGVFDGDTAMRFARISLNERFDSTTNEVKKIIEDEYRSMLKAIGTVANFPRHDYAGGAPGAKFVGAESCRDCHPNTYLKWESTKHAAAFASLEHDPKPNTIYDAECVSCHTTGFGYNSGWVSAAETPGLKGNQCENCHGPASRHIEEPDDLSFRKALALTAEQADRNRLCVRCHDEDNSPKFDFQTYMTMIFHKGLDDYSDPKVHQGIAPKVPAETAAPKAE